MSNEFTHFDSKGNAIIVDVTEKQKTERVAVAVGKIKVSKETLDLILAGKNRQGRFFRSCKSCRYNGIKANI